MKRIISVSTGLLYRITEDKNEQIERIRPFSPKGIELMLNSPESVRKIKLKEENISYLRSLEFVTIHAPSASGVIYQNDKETEGLLEKLSFLYNEVGAKNITFHIDQITDCDILSSYPWQYSVENSDNRKSCGQKPEEMEKFLIKDNQAKFTFDFAHAMQVNPDYVKKFLELKEKISEIHVSVCQTQLKEHHFISRNLTKIIEKKLNLLPAGCPFVTEAVAISEEEVPYIKTEILFLSLLD